MTLEDQPPEVTSLEPGNPGSLPPPAAAAERIKAFLMWYGDGLIEPLVAEQEAIRPQPPLYARDLESLGRAAQTGAGVESRGGSLDAGTPSTVATKTARVVVATYQDGEPMPVAGIPEDADPTHYLEAWSAPAWSDVHLARETVSYERLP